jgi:hypothetical protein
MPNLLELAQALLNGTPVAKAEGPETDPDKPTPGAPSEEEMQAARKEAQAGQQAAAAQGAEGQPGAPGAPGAPGGEGPEHEAGEGPAQEEAEHASGEEEDDEVSKADVLKSITFIAEQHGITGEEIAKAFSGLEGDPSRGKEPVGKGVEYLEGLLKSHTDILERIAGFLQELAGHTIKIGENVTKSLEVAEVAKSLSEQTAATVDALPKTAPAKAPKAADGVEIAKAEGPGQPKLSGADLFKMALDPKCTLSPQEMARTNRAAQGTFGG